MDYVTSGVLKGDMIVLEICEIYGWTYQEYYSQPQEFIDLAIRKLEAQRKIESQNKQNHGKQ